MLFPRSWNNLRDIRMYQKVKYSVEGPDSFFFCYIFETRDDIRTCLNFFFSFLSRTFPPKKYHFCLRPSTMSLRPPPLHIH